MFLQKISWPFFPPHEFTFKKKRGLKWKLHIRRTLLKCNKEQQQWCKYLHRMMAIQTYHQQQPPPMNIDTQFNVIMNSQDPKGNLKTCVEMFPFRKKKKKAFTSSLLNARVFFSVLQIMWPNTQ
jgi:hypothetical protein